MRKLLRIIGIIIILFFAVWGIWTLQKPVIDGAARQNADGEFIELKEGVVHYETAGKKSDPVLLLIHGSNIPYLTWDRNFYKLAEAGIFVIRYDMYGRGYSDRPLLTYDSVLYTDQIIQLVQKLRIKGAFHIAGVSMGGAVAAFLAARIPDRITSIIFIDPLTSEFTGINPIAFTKRMHSYLDSRDKTQKKRYAERKKKMQKIMLEQFKYKGAIWAIFSAAIHYEPDELKKTYSIINKKNIPVLLLWGKQDPLLPVWQARAITNTITNAKFIGIDKSGHLPNNDKAEIVNQAMIDFLKNHSAF